MALRTSITVAGAMLLAGSPIALANAQTATSAVAVSPEIVAAVGAKTRTPANVARDQYRHPAETLSFFGVTGKQTVVEYFPGGGWYTEILAPLAAKGGGTYYAAQGAGRGRDALAKTVGENPQLYGQVKFADLPEVPTGVADTVLTFRNVTW
jgi:predicted methyltransferase